MEIGSPMAAMYLLGNPDCYKSHIYVNFAWRTYVTFVKKYWFLQLEAEARMGEDVPEDNVAIQSKEGEFMASSVVDDYAMRPAVYERVNLYEWIQCSQK
ncbi:hypothetical protein B0H17DRAFT_907037, partial [Mycena rosella]